VRSVNGSLTFDGPVNKKKLLKGVSLYDGTKLLKTKFKHFVQSVRDKFNATRKQLEWVEKFPGILNNFRLILKTEVRSRVKSHSFMRFNNLLPKVKDNLCPRCLLLPESSDHILFECVRLRDDALVSRSILNRFFKTDIDLDSFLTVLSNVEVTRVLQMITLYCSWMIRCKLRHNENVSPNLFPNLISGELKRFLLKNPAKSEDWRPLIQSFGLQNLEIILVNLTSAPI
jgi:hypothetical protein